MLGRSKNSIGTEVFKFFLIMLKTETETLTHQTIVETDF